MILADLVAGDSVFVDANLLIYYFVPHPAFGAACNQLVQRIENLEVRGFTSTHILAELAHQLIVIEASTLPGWTPGKVKQRLRQQPGVIQKLHRFRTAVETVLRSSLQVLTIAPGLLGTAAVISQQHDLLTNDAVIVAVMYANGLTKVASHDSDFDRVPGLSRYAPS
jgi:predicted nucleic acid-binding protein